MRNLKSFQAAKCVLAGVELMHMTGKDQLMLEGYSEMSATNQFYVLTGQTRQPEGLGFIPANIT